MSDLKDRLKKALDYRGFSQSALAEQTGITKAMVSQYCLGRKVPRGSTLVGIAEKLDVPYEWLKMGDEYGEMTGGFDSKRYYPDALKIDNDAYKTISAVNDFISIRKLPSGDRELRIKIDSDCRQDFISALIK